MTQKFWTIVVVVALLSGATGAWLAKRGTQAEASPAEQSQGRSGGAAAFAQFAQFRDAHKYTNLLTMQVGKIARLEREGANPITPAQAKQMLAVLNPLRTQKKLDQEQAKDTIRALQRILTMEQRTDIARMPAMRRRMPGGAPHGGAPRGGASSSGQASSGQNENDPEKTKNYNPFNPESPRPKGVRGAERWNAFFLELEEKAEQE